MKGLGLEFLCSRLQGQEPIHFESQRENFKLVWLFFAHTKKVSTFYTLVFECRVQLQYHIFQIDLKMDFVILRPA